MITTLPRSFANVSGCLVLNHCETEISGALVWSMVHFLSKAGLGQVLQGIITAPSLNCLEGEIWRSRRWQLPGPFSVLAVC